jgi:Protein of unknown function (DUF2723)
MPDATPVSLRHAWLRLSASALVLFALTAHRGLQGQDSGWQQFRIIAGQLEHPNGLVLTHPLHYWLGRAALALPLSPGHAITLVSVLASAIAVANVGVCVLRLVRDVGAAWLAAATLALAHTFWMHATHTESYGLVAALLTAEWLCIAMLSTTAGPSAGGWLVALAAANGFGLANHMLASLMLPVDAVVMVWALRSGRAELRHVLLAAAVWLIAASPYWGLVVAVAIGSGDWPETLKSALVGGGGRYEEQVLNLSVSSRALGLAGLFLLYNFPNLGLPLAAHALSGRTIANRVFFRAMLAVLAIYGLFVLRYTIIDQYTFMFPLYAALALLAGLGLADIRATWTPARARWLTAAAMALVVATPLCYLAAHAVLSEFRLLSGMVGNRPFRDGYREYFLPWGVGDDSTERMISGVSQAAGADGVVVCFDVMAQHPLRSAQKFGGLAPGVEIFEANRVIAPELLARFPAWRAAGREIILIALDRSRPGVSAGEGVWTPRGDLFVWTAK